MTAWRRWRVAIAAAALVPAAPALGSGGPAPTPTFIDHTGGSEAERKRLFDGQMGVLLASASDGMLLINWRLLHGLPVGVENGVRLTSSCCDWEPYGTPDAGIERWRAARMQVAGDAPSRINPERQVYVDYYQWQLACFRSAFDTATSALERRIAAYGAASPWVRAWLAAQDAVFQACDGTSVELPALASNAPGWLRKDRAYQQAALDFYSGRYPQAADQFATIARDRHSPWRRYGLYLAARSLSRDALQNPDKVHYDRVSVAVNAVLSSKDDLFGKDDARGIRRAIDFRQRPLSLLATVERELNAPSLPSDAPVALADYMRTARDNASPPSFADWAMTLNDEFGWPDVEAAKARWAETLDLGWLLIATQEPTQVDAVARARSRFTESGDVAWLLAAFAMAPATDPTAASLVADGEAIREGHPGWLTAQYHIARLTISTADPARIRARIDPILARRNLSRTDRNLFLGIRAQVASSLDDFVRFAVRHPICTSTKPDTCVEDGYPENDSSLARTDQGFVGLGEDARALIDRMPLAMRAGLARHPGLPAPLRLDIALTSFGRAVALRDDRIVDQLAKDMAGLMPEMRADWRRIGGTPSGSAKRFAELVTMSRLPGLTADLATYQRTAPMGYYGYWPAWATPAPASRVKASYPEHYQYNSDGIWRVGDEPDYICRGKCGAGGFPLHLPQFLARAVPQAEREYARTILPRPDYGKDYPANASFLWEELLDHARANPRDPRSPEALYRLIRIARWGGDHDLLGKRAFELLHQRYPGSGWAAKSPYWYKGL